MATSTEYQQMINSNLTHNTELRISLNAFSPLVQLAKPNRETFKTYCRKEGKKQPSWAIEPYLNSFLVSETGLDFGLEARQLLLKGHHQNKHKSILLEGIGQAYLDVCLAVSVADYCIKDMGERFDYADYLAVSVSAIEFCFDNISPFQSLAELPVINGVQNVLTGMVEMAKDKERSKQIALNRVNSAFKILKLWTEGKLKHDIEYDKIVQQIDVCIQEDYDKIFFSHIITVLRNKSDFTQEQMSFVNEAYENRFTEDQQKALLSNVPKDTPSVEETKAYFFKSTEEKTTSIFDVDLGANAE